MLSSILFLRKNQNNRSNSSLGNDSISDQSEEDDHNRIDAGYYKPRAVRNENNMLECPSDYDDSCSQSDNGDNDENEDEDSDDDDDEKENDLFTYLKNTQSSLLKRQKTLYEDDWPRRNSFDESKLQKLINRNEKSLFETEQDKTLFLDLNQHRLFPSERNKLAGNFNTTHRSCNTHRLLSNDSIASAQQFQLQSESDNMQTTATSSTYQLNTNSIVSPLHQSKQNEPKQQFISKVPVRTNSSSHSRSHSPHTKTSIKQGQLPAGPSRIPVPLSTTSKGAFRFFTAIDRASSSSSSLHMAPTATTTTELAQPSSQKEKTTSPFTPITQPKLVSSSKKTSSSAGNTPLVKHRLVQEPSSEDDDQSDTENLKEADLKLKLKEQKRHRKKTGEILNKLHENYEELLEKYAQAENTIDQLRFQPKLAGDNVTPTHLSTGTVHFIEQPKVQLAEVRSNGIYYSVSNTPFSSIAQVPSATSITTTVTRSADKSTSPATSGTVESVFFDETGPQKIIVQELNTPETIKLDLLIQTKTLADKMKSFLTLMDTNQLSLSEQKQVYENIRGDYEKLLKACDISKNSHDVHDIDFDADLNNELETMKQLLKEIVKRITDNLLGKSTNQFENEHLMQEQNRLSQSSNQSFPYNHSDLMNQYKRIMDVVSTDSIENKKDTTSLTKTASHDSYQSDVSNPTPPAVQNNKPYVCVSGNSDDEQQQISDTTSIPLLKGIESAVFTVDHLPLTSIQQYQQLDEEQTHIHGSSTKVLKKKKKLPNRQSTQEYDNLENITQTKLKTKLQQKRIANSYQNEKELTPSSTFMPRVGPQCSASSFRTRTSDYDSGIGTNNTTKLSRDSKLNTSIMDESHYQSLDEEQRRYSDEERESLSNLSSSRSSGSGAASPGSPYSKYTKRSDRSTLLKQFHDTRRRKPSGLSDASASDIETHLVDSLDTFAQSVSSKRRSDYNWLPQQTTKQRLQPRVVVQRSLSTDNIDFEKYRSQSYRSTTASRKLSKVNSNSDMSRKYQSGFIHQHHSQSKYSPTMYKSSFYVDEAHTHQKSQEKLNQKNSRQHKKQIQSTNLYLDPQSGVIYQHIQNKTQPSSVPFCQPIIHTKSEQPLYKCNECGSINSYDHRHHIGSFGRRIINDTDDPGYESENRKQKRSPRYSNHLISSDSDSDDKLTVTDVNTLNEAYERAKRVQQHSQNLSKNISRQLKLVLSTL